LENIEDIISVNDVDIIFIGPYDLSQSLGVPGQVNHPLVEEKMQHIVDICTSKGIAVGTFVDSISNAKKWTSLGVRYIAYSVDMGIFFEATKSILSEINRK